jgi:hypothetical protein
VIVEEYSIEHYAWPWRGGGRGVGWSCLVLLWVSWTEEKRRREDKERSGLGPKKGGCLCVVQKGSKRGGLWSGLWDPQVAVAGGSSSRTDETEEKEIRVE